MAAALAAVLALAVQTDVLGVPWLAYCLWWLAGSLVLQPLRDVSHALEPRPGAVRRPGTVS